MKSPAPSLEPGLYQHFKGPLYLVVGTSIDCDTQEVRVRYYPLYGDFRESSRPLSSFLEDVKVVMGLEEDGSTSIQSKDRCQRPVVFRGMFVVPRFKRLNCTREESIRMMGIISSLVP